MVQLCSMWAALAQSANLNIIWYHNKKGGISRLFMGEYRSFSFCYAKPYLIAVARLFDEMYPSYRCGSK